MTPDPNSHELFELYALGLLEEPERSLVEQALATGNDEARTRMRQALENNALLLASVPKVEPPARLRTRVLQAAGAARKKHHGWLWLWAAATASLAVMAFILTGKFVEHTYSLEQLRAELRTLSLRSAETNADLARARAILDILNAPESRFVTFGPHDPKPPRGRVVVNPKRGLLLLASNLPPAPNGRIYEMWLIPKGAKPVPAGLFQSAQSGNAMHYFPIEVAPESAVAVTVEPESGSAQPTSTPLFVAGI